MLRDPSEVWSMIVCSVGCYGDRGHDGDIAGGVELRSSRGRQLQEARDDGARGNRVRGSPRSCRDG